MVLISSFSNFLDFEIVRFFQESLLSYTMVVRVYDCQRVQYRTYTRTNHSILNGTSNATDIVFPIFKKRIELLNLEFHH